MINSKDNPVEWSLLLGELGDATEHLQELTKQLIQQGEMSEEDLRVQLFHSIAHLNRVWNMKNHEGDINQNEFEQYSQTPSDFFPT